MVEVEKMTFLYILIFVTLYKLVVDLALASWCFRLLGIKVNFIEVVDCKILIVETFSWLPSDQMYE